MIKALFGEAQFDTELAEAFRTDWITPRREAAKEVVQSAMSIWIRRSMPSIEGFIPARDRISTPNCV
jgi:hypothetical protein